MTRKLKIAVLEAPVTVHVAVHERVTSFDLGQPGEALLPLFYRRAEYMLPAYVVNAPMPTLTCRHLEKATYHLLTGHVEQALLAFKRAVASAIEPMTLIKVALACHTENHTDEAQAALQRALRYASKDTRSQTLIQAIAGHLNYAM